MEDNKNEIQKSNQINNNKDDVNVQLSRVYIIENYIIRVNNIN